MLGLYFVLFIVFAVWFAFLFCISFVKTLVLFSLLVCNGVVKLFLLELCYEKLSS